MRRVCARETNFGNLHRARHESSRATSALFVLLQTLKLNREEYFADAFQNVVRHEGVMELVRILLTAAGRTLMEAYRSRRRVSEVVFVVRRNNTTL